MIRIVKMALSHMIFILVIIMMVMIIIVIIVIIIIIIMDCYKRSHLFNNQTDQYDDKRRCWCHILAQGTSIVLLTLACELGITGYCHSSPRCAVQLVFLTNWIITTNITSIIMQLRKTFPLNFSLTSVASFNFYGKSVGERSRSVFKQGRVALIKTFNFFFVVETTKCYRYKWILA